MSTLLEQLPKRIARLEAKHGSDDPYVKRLKQQLDAIQHNQGKTGEEVYRMQAVKLPLKEQASSSSPDQEVKDWLETGMHQAARDQMSTDSPSEKTEGSVATVQKNEMQD